MLSAKRRLFCLGLNMLMKLPNNDIILLRHQPLSNNIFLHYEIITSHNIPVSFNSGPLYYAKDLFIIV